MGLFPANKLDSGFTETAISSVPSDIGITLARSWRWACFFTFVCIAVLLICFWHTFIVMFSTWYNSRTFSHCFLVFPVSMYLLWRNRAQLAAVHPAPKLGALFLLAPLNFVWLLGNLGEIRIVEEFAVIAILVVLIWALLGSAVIRKIAFPLALLFFAVPFGLGLISPLQDITAWIALHALTLSGIPAVLENRMLSVPSSTWTVAETCSGIRYLFSSVMVGAVYAWIVYQTRLRRIVFLLISVLISIVANGARAYCIVLLAYISNNRLAADVDHIVYGWLFFTLVQVTLFAVGLRWRQNSDLTQTHTMQPSTRVHSRWQFSATSGMLAAGLSSGMMASTILLAGHFWNRAPRADLAMWSDPPITVNAPWQPVVVYEWSWIPDLHGPNREFVKSYSFGRRCIDVYSALYSGPGFELLNSYNRVANPKSWAIMSEDSDYENINGEQTKVRRARIVSRLTARSVWTWYSVAGEYTSSPVRVKYLEAKARFFGTSPGIMVYVLSAESTQDDSRTEEALRDFLSHALFLR